MKTLLVEEQKQRVQDQQAKKEHIMAIQKKKAEMNRPVELVLYDIGNNLSTIGALLKILNVSRLFGGWEITFL